MAGGGKKRDWRSAQNLMESMKSPKKVLLLQTREITVTINKYFINISKTMNLRPNLLF